MRRFAKLVRAALTRTNINVPPQQQEPDAEKPRYKPRLLRLPVELVLIIAGLLSPEDAAALSLSCKGLHTLSLPLHSLSTAQRDSLLPRLERDLGASHFYCSYCSTLHGFLSLPRCYEVRPFKGGCCTSMEFQPPGLPYWLTYYHGRLVMNRHFYEPPSGLPLESLTAVTVDYYADYHWRRGVPWWTTEFTAAIIQDELVIYARHMLESTGLDALWAHIEEQYHFICNHLKTYDWAMYWSCQRETGHDSGHQSTQAIQYGCGSCSECPTDYTVEVTRAAAHGRINHKITVYSYHLMGSFRSHRDRNWRAMVDRGLGGEGEATSSSKFVPRDQVQVPPGFVRKQWLSRAIP